MRGEYRTTKTLPENRLPNEIPTSLALQRGKLARSHPIRLTACHGEAFLCCIEPTLGVIPLQVQPISFPAQNVVLNLEQAAELLQVHPRTVTKMAQAGEIPAFRCGRLWRFSASRLHKWIEEASIQSIAA